MPDEQDYSTSGMIALVPANAPALVVPGGDPADQLHLTLAYLGDEVDTWDGDMVAAVHRVALRLTDFYYAEREEAERLREAGIDPDSAGGVPSMSRSAAQSGPLEGTIFSHAVFNPNDGEAATVYLIDGSGDRVAIDWLRNDVVSQVRNEIGDVTFPDQREPFVPHITAGYGLSADQLTYTGPVTFDRIRVAIGNDITDYPLGGTEENAMPDTAPAELASQDNGVPVHFPVLAVEGLSTSDGRYIEAGALDHRALPIPILAQTQTPVGGGGHDGAHIIGRLDTLKRVAGPTVVSKATGKPFPEGTFVWTGSGYIDPEAPATGLAQKGYLTGNSVDLSEVEAFIEEDPDNPQADDDEEGGIKIGGPTGERMRLTKGVIAATTLVAIPAFADAYVELDGQRVEAAAGLAASATPSWRSAELGDETCLPCALDNAPQVAPGTKWVWKKPTPLVAAGDASLPPVAWFRDPELPGPTPLVITDDGRVYGHLAAWNTCHTGFTGRCVTTPRSQTDYAYFRTGARRVTGDDGQPIQVGIGKLTVVLNPDGDGHADQKLGAMPAAAHYDNAATAVADVEVGEDQHGVWVAGALRSTATPEQIDALLASPLSGDWRPINGHLELVAALGVNVPGFPIPRARVAAGQVVSLVAAGVLPRPLAATSPEDALADKIVNRIMRELGKRPPARLEDETTEHSDLAARKAAALAQITEADLESRWAAVAPTFTP